MPALKLLLGAVLAVAFLSPPTRVSAASTTWYVTPSGPGTSCSTDGQSPETAFASIQVAIDCASSGDTVNVAAGIYTENLSMSKNLSIIGAGKTSTTVRPQSGLLPVVTNSATSAIAQIRIRSGSEGGLRNDGTLALSRSNVVGLGLKVFANRGGITNLGTLIVRGSRVANHRTGKQCGGGINSSGNLRVLNSQIVNNSSSDNCGGGILIAGPTSITGSTIRGNIAELDGGGIMNVFEDGTVTVSRSKIINNFGNRGGGISNGYTMMIRDTEIFGNEAGDIGGGIRNNGGSVSLVDSRVVMNEAGSDGGGIHNTGTVSISPDTEVSGNVPNDCVGC